MRTTLNVAAIAAVSTLALAGCGKSNSDTNANAGSSTPVGTSSAAVPATNPATGGSTPATTTASSPRAEWANQLCTAMAGKVKPVQPPTVASTSPSDTQKSLVTFLGSVINAETLQLQTLKQVGPPPGPSATSDWKAATKKLRGIRKKLNKIKKELAATSPNDAKALQTEVTALGTKLKVLATYQGPVVDLSTSKAIGAAVTADPACKALA